MGPSSAKIAKIGLPTPQGGVPTGVPEPDFLLIDGGAGDKILIDGGAGDFLLIDGGA